MAGTFELERELGEVSYLATLICSKLARSKKSTDLLSELGPLLIQYGELTARTVAGIQGLFDTPDGPPGGSHSPPRGN